MKIFGKKIYLSVVIAGIGLIGGIMFVFTKGDPPAPPYNNLVSPPETPFTRSVSGTGAVEANSRNIDIGVFVSGIVSEVPVKEGDKVKKGDILLVIDKTSAEADINIAKAGLKLAQIQLADEEDLLNRYNSLQSGISISATQKQRQIFAVSRAKAGVESAEAALKAAEILLEKHTITAPVAGEILKVRVQKGEFAATSSPLSHIVMGNTEPLYLRVQIDENDLWRFNKNSNAVAYLRSNRDYKYNLKFVRIEPLVQPKTQLSGNSAELVDTRIMEIIYSVDTDENSPLYVGQQLDVFIDSEK